MLIQVSSFRPGLKSRKVPGGQRDQSPGGVSGQLGTQRLQVTAQTPPSESPFAPKDGKPALGRFSP